MSCKKITFWSSKDPDSKENETKTILKVAERPVITIKTREGENRAISPSLRNGNKKEAESQGITVLKSTEAKNLTTPCLELTNCIQLMNDTLQLCENALDYLQDQQDFLVIGVLGAQGVGKSQVLSMLASNCTSEIFPSQTMTHHENGKNCTKGIDFYITKNRVIYLDTQPILSLSAMDSVINFEQKKNPGDFVNAETNVELQSLQFAAFLLSVCHVVIVVQDWFVDPNIVRFLQAAEMLKPSSTTTMDQQFVEYYPHILFLHNKAEIQDFSPENVEMMKEFYSKTFAASRLQTHSSLDMSEYSTEAQLNFFLIPNFPAESDTVFHENEENLIKRLKIKIHGVARNALTPTSLTEKSWYHYASKVMEAIKKSHLSSEYGRLMP